MPYPDTRADLIAAACLILAVIQAVMLASLFAGVAPHPPRAIPLFAMPPFLSVSIGTALAACLLAQRPTGQRLAIPAALFALLSFGPQKYLDPAFPEIWIAVIASQAAVLTIAYALIAQPTASRARHAN
ncbi:hypothetical protein [Roseovarius indicus]|uniref:hypothetical protein n=1 Tax=Roseovarius indicus TaxID=540747 RepID=UPI0032EF4243